MNARANIAELDHAPRPRTQEVSVPLRESRKQRVAAYITQFEETEQEFEEMRKDRAALREEVDRQKVVIDGFKTERDIARTSEAAMRAERDAAVHERIRLETIFGTIKNLMTQANFEIENKDA